MPNSNELIEKICAGEEFSQDEFYLVIDKVIDCIPENEATIKDDKNLPVLIHILGKVGTEELSPLIEKFLYYPKNPDVSAYALQALCSEWGLTSEYLDVVKKLICGEEWDSSDDVRLKAIYIAGDYLSDNFNKDLLKLLLDVFEGLGTIDNLRENRVYARNSIKSWAYDAICLAMGKSWEEIATFSDKTEELIATDQCEALDQEMLQRAHDKLKNS